MKKILILCISSMFSFFSYGQNWYKISKELHKIELKQNVFEKDKKKKADYFFKFRNSLDFLKMSKCQIGDTLYINEYTSIEGNSNIQMIDNKRDYSYEMYDCGINFKNIVLELIKEPFKMNSYYKIILSWNLKKMRCLSKKYSEKVFDGGTNHFYRIILKGERKNELELFITKGFALNDD